MQAPIGCGATVELVAAVSGAGGLGCLAGTWTEAGLLRARIAGVRELTDAPFCVNVVTAFASAERVELLVAERVPWTSFSFGVPVELVGRAVEGGCSVLVQVGSAEAAVRAVEAGGRRGRRAPRGRA
jgi:NAD(P)H-dependent flavin oxidoreductase YrpB (nitropropane dioxygenase family)